MARLTRQQLDLLLQTDLPHHLRLVWLILLAHADQNGSAWPSAQRLAEYTGKSERSVQRDLAQLERFGAITRGDQRKAWIYPPGQRPVVWDVLVVHGTHIVGTAEVTPDVDVAPTYDVGVGGTYDVGVVKGTTPASRKVRRGRRTKEDEVRLRSAAPAPPAYGAVLGLPPVDETDPAAVAKRSSLIYTLWYEADLRGDHQLAAAIKPESDRLKTLTARLTQT